MKGTPDYEAFLASKQLIHTSTGLDIDPALFHPRLFPHQRDVARLAIRKGCFAILLDAGLGKTLPQLEYGRIYAEATRMPSLFVAPLSVAKQTILEAEEKLGMKLRYVQSQSEVGSDLWVITNYEHIHKFDPDKFGQIILDESSILKNLDGRTRRTVTERFKDVPRRLCNTATPAPNDITEIANHAEFLGIMKRSEMLARFFTYDNASGTSKSGAYRLKGHAVDIFYQWLASWSVAARRPSDLGYDDTGYIRPEVRVKLITVDADYTPPGMLPGFGVGAISAIDAKRIRRTTIDARAERIAEMVNADTAQWIVWCGLNNEADTLTKLLDGAVNVEGAMLPDAKADAIEAFQRGDTKVLVSKTKICGFGMNFQTAHKMAFAGMDYSWEAYYQAVKRCDRYGQQHPVEVYVVTSEQERPIFETVMAKEREANTMIEQLVERSRLYSIDELHGVYNAHVEYEERETEGDGWKMLLGDSAKRMAEIEADSVDLSIYSPPFLDIFTYTASPRDLGNSDNPQQFWNHYDFIIRENFRVTKPGRLCCVHIADGRALKGVDGYIGRKDFTGDCIEAYQRAGWVFRQRITIDKNPQAQAIRLRDHGLQFTTFESDATDLMGGHPDYLLVFRKPGENEVPVKPVENGELSRNDWIVYAHPVWYDIRETETLNVEVARGDKDEKHMCPLQLPLIKRCVQLWSNPGELVLSPFGGIGSEGYEAIRLNRRFVGIELKREYFEVACRNLENAEKLRMPTLWAYAARQAEQAQVPAMAESEAAS